MPKQRALSQSAIFTAHSIFQTCKEFFQGKLDISETELVLGTAHVLDDLLLAYAGCRIPRLLFHKN